MIGRSEVNSEQKKEKVTNNPLLIKNKEVGYK